MRNKEGKDYSWHAADLPEHIIKDQEAKRVFQTFGKMLRRLLAGEAELK
jgi:hypothetical protein